MRKLIIATLLALVFLSGCDEAKNDPVVNETFGNFSAKAEEPSSDNKVDIQFDLIELNYIVNKFNTESINLSRKLITASREGDNYAIVYLLKESKKLTESTSKSLLYLNLKSSEIQKIRLDIYKGNEISIKVYDLYAKENKSDAEKQEFVLLKKQMVSLQKTVGSALDQINSQYKVQ